MDEKKFIIEGSEDLLVFHIAISDSIMGYQKAYNFLIQQNPQSMENISNLHNLILRLKVMKHNLEPIIKPIVDEALKDQ